MKARGHGHNPLSLLILFAIGVLNFLTQDHLHGGVWLSIAAGAISSDLLEKRRFPEPVARALLTVEVAAIFMAGLFTAFLIAK